MAAKFFLINFLVVLIFQIGRIVIGGDKLAQETLIPLYFTSLTIFWIGLNIHIASNPRKSAKIFEKPFAAFTWFLLAALATVAAPSVFLPVAIKDFGSIIVAANLFLPLTVFFLVSKFRIGVPLLTACAVVFILGAALYLNSKNLTSYTNHSGIGVKRALARMISFKEASEVQNWLIYTNRVGRQGRLPYQELLNCNIHSWGNQSVVHTAGWFGNGYGNSPNQLSQIPQNMLLFDSVFSFFVVGEYGLIGGILLSLYALPFLIVFIAGRKARNVGYLLASVICASFLLEALYHAGMNLSLFPMSGRNLPLMSVYSPSDILKWVMIFILLIQAVLMKPETTKPANRENSMEPAGEITHSPETNPANKRINGNK